jgi:hypothetical protein
MQKHTLPIKFLVIIFFIPTLVIPTLADEGNSDDPLTRGGTFSITITGKPSTPYYIWLTRTFTMTGNFGDQPPVIVAFQSGIQQDPPDGPYSIGHYAFHNGNGRTIIDDVAPSSLAMSNTNYYALVTTDTNGRVVVAFQTSPATATRTFSIKVENPGSAENSNLLVERNLPFKVPTTHPKEFPTFVPQTPAVTITSNPSIQPVKIIETTIPQPTQTSPQKSPLWGGHSILSVIVGSYMLRKKLSSRSDILRSIMKR